MRDALLPLLLTPIAAVAIWMARDRLKASHAVVCFLLGALSAAVVVRLHPLSIRDMSGLVEFIVAAIASTAAWCLSFSGLFIALLVIIRSRNSNSGTGRRYGRPIPRAPKMFSAERYIEQRNLSLTLSVLSGGLLSIYGLASGLMTGRMFNFLRIVGLPRNTQPLPMDLTFKEWPGSFALQIAICGVLATGFFVWGCVRLMRVKFGE